MLSIQDFGSTPLGPTPAQNDLTSVAADDFFQVLSAQLTGQNPLEPIDETQFMGQLAQFSQLEQTISTNQHLAAIALLQENLAAIQQMTQGSVLIGQTVEYTNPDGSTLQGTVDAIRVEQGLVVLDVGGESIPLPAVQAVLGSTES